MRALLRNSAGAVLVVLIMFVGSLVLWVGTPLAWLWIGSQIQGSTESLGTALGAMFVGVVLTVTAIASVLAKLSDVYRGNCLARGMNDPGHVVLEAVLVVSAGLTLVAFVIWFFFFAGASPVPLGMHL
ncbi:MAG: hypothetical protein M3Y09_14515 [Actinomycetota bacterium]|nr:hypothetical protein [Actinomycetota bacterium]